MKHVLMTPHGRQPVPAGLMASLGVEEQPALCPPAEKWTVLRDLTTARRAIGVSDRDLTVLAALLACYPQPELSESRSLIVFPSNSTLSARAHGMAESTLRRHLASLVQAGLIERRDSPNGKRYARRNPLGTVAHAYGFDLRPLLIRASEIAVLASDVRQLEHELRCKRDAVVIRMREISKVIQWGQQGTDVDWSEVTTACAEIQKGFRRKLSNDQLNQLSCQIDCLAAMVLPLLPSQAPQISPEVSGTDSQNERHIQDSYRDIIESEVGIEQTEATQQSQCEIPLEVVLKAAPDLLDYAPSQLRTWRDLGNAASVVCPMMGISQSVWLEACRMMGSSAAAITVACILQRCAMIRQPAAYLRALARKARSGSFLVGPMVMALLRTNGDHQPPELNR